MGRTTPQKSINRNNNNIKNGVSKFGAVWLNSDGEPIEDSSSGNKSTSPDSPRFRHALNYIHTALFPQASGDHCTGPQKQPNFAPSSSTHKQERGDYIKDYVYNELFGDRDRRDTGYTREENRNFISMLNRHYQLSSDSYTESDLSEPVVVERKETLDNYDLFKTGVGSPEKFELEKENRDENVLIFNQHSGPDNKTFWMYTSNQCNTSADKDCKLDIDIPNSSSSDGKDSSKQVPIKNREARVPTPTPPSFISKYSLPLMATLPTVTEIKTPKNISPRLQKKTINSWFDTREQGGIDCKTCFSVPLSAKETKRQLKLRPKQTQATQANFMLTTVNDPVPKQTISTQTDIKMDFFINLQQTIPVIEKMVNKESNDTFVIAVADAEDVTGTPAVSSIKAKVEDILNENCFNKTRLNTIFDPTKQEPASDARDVINWIEEIKTEGNIPALGKALGDAKNDSEHINKANKVPKCVSWPRDRTQSDSDNSGPVDFQATFRSTGEDKKRRVFIRAGPWGDFSSIVDSPQSLHISLSETTSFEGNLTWWRRMLNCIVCK